MPTINKRLEILERTLEAHLIESGEIRSDLKWLKRSFWTLASGIITLNVISVGYVIAHIINK